MKQKFRIIYPKDYEDESLRGLSYKPPAKSMVVMSGGGVFFLYHGEPYNSWIKPLAEVLPKFDVIWK